MVFYEKWGLDAPIIIHHLCSIATASIAHFIHGALTALPNLPLRESPHHDNRRRYNSNGSMRSRYGEDFVLVRKAFVSIVVVLIAFFSMLSNAIPASAANLSSLWVKPNTRSLSAESLSRSTNGVVNVKDFGASGSAETTKGSIVSGSHILKLSHPIDYKNGMGIFVPNAGPMSSEKTPGAPTVQMGGGASGTYTYGYRVVALDGRGGGSAASAVGSLTTGPATLGGLGPNGAGNAGSLYKAKWISITISNVATAPGGFAVYRTVVPPESGLSTGFIGIYSYTNAPFLDYGQPVKTPPPGVPVNPPDSPLADSLISTVRHGGGTTTLTLANAAYSPVSRGTVYHDDTAAFEAALKTNPSRLYVPKGTYGISSALTYRAENGVIYGDGASSRIRYQGDSSATLILGASGITLRDMQFDGQKVSYELVTVTSPHPLDNITIRSTVGESSGFGGIYVDNPIPSTSAWYHNVTITGNTYSDCEYGYSTVGNIRGIVISQNRVYFTDYNDSGRGISLHNSDSPDGYTFTRRFVITHNTLRCGNHSAAIVIQGSGSGIVSHNALLISGGIYAFWGIGAGQTVAASGGYTFADNFCQALWTGTGVAVNLTNVVDVAVRNNRIEGFGYAFQAGGYGVPAFPDALSNHVIIAGNRLRQIAFSPILGALPVSVQYTNNGE